MQNGFDYVLTYYDDPKAAFPSFAYNWMATTGKYWRLIFLSIKICSFIFITVQRA